MGQFEDPAVRIGKIQTAQLRATLKTIRDSQVQVAVDKLGIDASNLKRGVSIHSSMNSRRSDNASEAIVQHRGRYEGANIFGGRRGGSTKNVYEEKLPRRNFVGDARLLE